jgi:hypothetical protein
MGIETSKLQWDCDDDEIPTGRIIRDRKEFIKNAKTGDILLFQGAGCASCMIRCLSLANTFSHVAMVIEYEGQKLCTEAYAGIIGYDVIRKDMHTGIQFIDLETRLEQYDTCRISYRSLNLPVDKALLKAVIDHYRAYDHKDVPRYNMDLKDLYEYGTGTDFDKNIHNGRKHYVCTSWVGNLLIKLGIAPKDAAPGNYTLALFSMTPEHGGWYGRMGPMYSKYEYSELYYLCFAEEKKKKPRK